MHLVVRSVPARSLDVVTMTLGDALGQSPVEPWLVWMLLALARHLDRQKWLMKVWRTHLGPELPRRGELPGIPGWKYALHGVGLRLVAPHGERIDVNDTGDHGHTIDPYFFTDRLESLLAPELPEKRVHELFPTADAQVAILRVLGERGYLTYGESRHSFRLCERLEAAAEAIATLDLDNPEVRIGLASWVCDHEWLERERGSSRDIACATQQRVARVEFWKPLLTCADTANGAIDALERLISPDDFVQCCSVVLKTFCGGQAGHAIERLDALPEAPMCEAVFEFLFPPKPGKQHPYSSLMAIRYLLRRDLHHAAVIAKIRALAEVDAVDGYTRNPFLEELTLLLVEHAPEHALGPIHRALRDNLQDVAATLALLDQSWCHRVLLSTLERATSYESSSSIRSALLRTRAADARHHISTWERLHVLHHDAGRGFTFEEANERSSDAWMEERMNELRPWVESIRHRIPDDLDGRVWS